jgi:hypothetical protein
VGAGLFLPPPLAANASELLNASSADEKEKMSAKIASRLPDKTSSHARHVV